MNQIQQNLISKTSVYKYIQYLTSSPSVYSMWCIYFICWL